MELHDEGTSRRPSPRTQQASYRHPCIRRPRVTISHHKSAKEEYMAYMENSVTFENGLRLFNIDNAVGVNGNNLPGDTMLVQWFINKLREHPMGLKGTTIDVDGDCGPLTKFCIKQTQDQLRDIGYTVKSDGHIDPIVVELPKEQAYSLFNMQLVCDRMSK